MASMKLSNDAVLSQATYDKYARLDQGGKVVATYIWVDTFGSGELLRSKSRVLEPEQLSSLDKVPLWVTPTPKDPRNLHGVVYEDVLHPVAMYRDPFLGDPNKLVLCHVLTVDGKPTVGNNRQSCKEAMDRAKDHKPWFGIEQEYFLVEVDKQMLGWPKPNGYPEPMGPAHCGSGASRVFGRHIVDSHLRACLYAGLKIDGTNAEVVPAQWEFQVGPSEGIEAGDHLWMARYLLVRVAEDFGVDVSFKPSPIVNTQDWMGSGAHCNFSTAEMRKPGTGLAALEDACRKLANRHMEHMKKYDLKGGEDNKTRLEGCFDKFTWAIADRGASVRIPRICAHNQCGYLEDRRPAANSDPYSVTEMLVRTICLDE